MLLRPNREHPASAGFVCHKGIGFIEVHEDPDRVNYPLRRLNPRTEDVGQFERVSWDSAIEDIGQRLRAIIDAHWPDAIAVYVGNPAAFNSRMLQVGYALPTRLGTTRSFCAAIQDMANKPIAMHAMFGSSVRPVADFYNSSYHLCLGTNPAMSKWAYSGVARPMARPPICRPASTRGGRGRCATG